LPGAELFDDWPERYEEWFNTPIGRLVRRVEAEVVVDLLSTGPGECLLDAGCGTGVFTTDFMAAGASAVGLDISFPMLKAAIKKAPQSAFSAILGDMDKLPFRGNSFTKTVSITALEFIEHAGNAIDELFRVTRPGGYVLVATLNSLSPWAERRRAKTIGGQRHILENAFYRSPEDLLALSPLPGICRTAVYFEKDDDVVTAAAVEERGRQQNLKTGAFVAVRWQKPPAP
jgi:ubiquinone/menaquinone biosynthesis C-methylase UbiE